MLIDHSQKDTRAMARRNAFMPLSRYFFVCALSGRLVGFSDFVCSGFEGAVRVFRMLAPLGQSRFSVAVPVMVLRGF